jgi:hypothetical protein
MALNIFGDAPQSLTGLLGEQATEDLRKKALTTGLINAAIGYIAQPKNQRYGSALPYLGRALMAGQQGAQGVYEGAITDWERQQKIAEMKRQQQQRESFDVAAKNLYTTTPAQFETVSTPGGYAPQQTGIMSDQVSPNYGMTRLPDVTTQRQIAPARQELNQEALMKLALSGDPRAKTYVDTLVAMKDLNPQAKPTGQLLSLEQAKLLGLPTESGQRWQKKPDNTYEIVSGTSPSKEGSLTNDRDATAFELYAKPFNQLNQSEAGIVNKRVEQISANKAPKVSVNLSDPTAKAKAAMDVSERANKFYETDINTANQFKVIKDLSQVNPNPTGDTTLLYTYFKVLDPTSTVREGEIQMVKDSRAIPDKFKAYAQRLAGGGSLTQAERNEIYRQAESKVKTRQSYVNKTRKAWIDNAKRLELDPELYVPNPYADVFSQGNVKVDY